MSKTTLEQTAEFHRIFNHPIAIGVGDEDLKIRQLRIKLLFEELEELAVATDCQGTFQELCDTSPPLLHDAIDGDNVDHVEELDALCDLQVVLDGKFLTSGHWQHKDKAFAEVHRSNMSKTCTTVDKASMSVYNYLNQGVIATKEENNGVWVIKRDDGKILKGIDFSEPDLKQFVK